MPRRDDLESILIIGSGQSGCQLAEELQRDAHVAFSADQARYDEVKARMTKANVEPTMAVDHDWCHSVYYADPNGILVEFCRDTPGFEPNPKLANELLTAIPGTKTS